MQAAPLFVPQNETDATTAEPLNEEGANMPSPEEVREEAERQDAANTEYNRASLCWLELLLRRLVEEKHREAADKNRSLLPVPLLPAAPLPLSTPASGAATPMESRPRRNKPGIDWPFSTLRFFSPTVVVKPEQEVDVFVAESPAPIPPSPAIAYLPVIPTVSDEQIQDAAQERERLLAAAPQPPVLFHVAAALALSPFERDTLLLCAAPELRTDFGSLCAAANEVLGLTNTPQATFTLALALLKNAAFDVLSPERPLRYWNVVEPVGREGQSLVAAPLQTDGRIVNALRGLKYSDARLSAFLRSPEPWPPTLLAPGSTQAEALDEILWGWNRALTREETAQGELPVVQLLGADTPAKIRLAAHAAASFRSLVYRVPLEELASPNLDLETTTRLLLRESRLSPIALYVDAHQGLGGGQENNRAPLLRRFLSLVGGRLPLFLGVREAWERDQRTDLAVEIRLPTPAEQRAAWTAALGADAGDLPDRLAAQFRLDTPEIRTLVADSRFEAEHRQKTLDQTLWKACRDRVSPRLDALAHRIVPRARQEDLILPPDTSALIDQIAAQVAHRSTVYTDWGFAERSDRGLGISVLFAGESGTGKTMAAEVLANTLQLSLYRIDLSSVVSKYIGETEENLRKVFDAAEEGGVVLFFDEADALFGKRTEVKDSHDRYANIEVNYLLQRMEAYQGLAILATNRKSAVDTAFLRRLRFLVTFPLPGVAERKRLWERAFPASTPVEGLDIDRLARLILSGGNIASVAINAAFLAAEAKGPVTMPLILRAARNEYVKMDRALNEADFR